MDALMQELQERWMSFLGVAACCLPLVVIFRRQVLPVVWYVCEIGFYLVAFHALLHLVVRMCRWFKHESTFGALGEKVDPGWQTPLVEFWHASMYTPSALLYLEGAVAALILYLVWRFRPFKAQKLRARRPAARQGLASKVRPVPSRSEAHR